MFSLSNHAQLGGIVSGIVVAGVAMMILGMVAIVGSNTRGVVDDGCVNTTGGSGGTLNTNCTHETARSTLDNLMDGTEDGSDMGKILLFAIPAIAVLGLFIGLTRLA